MKEVKFKLSDKKINLKILNEGIYNFYFLGGFYLDVGNRFSLTIINSITKEKVGFKEKFPKANSYKLGKRAVLYCQINFVKSGEYELILEEIEDIEIRNSRLLILNLFNSNSININDIEIFIKKKALTYKITQDLHN